MKDGSGFDHGAWIGAALAHLAVRLQHEVALARALNGERQEGFLGLFLDGAEAERLLASLAGRLRAESVPDGAALARGAAALISERGGAWARLAEQFYLTEAELDVLLLAAAPALDPRFGRVYGFLNDDLTRRHLTPALAMRLGEAHGIDALSWRGLFAPEAPLRQHRLLLCDPAQPFLESPLRIDESLLDLLLGAPPRADGLLLLPAADRPQPLPRAVTLIVTPPGGGAGQDGGALAMDLAAARGLVGLIEWRGQGSDALARACRDAHLSGALPVLTGFDAAPEPRALLGALSAPAVILSASPGAWQQAGFAGEIRLAPALPVAERHARIDALLRGHPGEGAALRAALRRAEHLPLLALAERLTAHDTAEALVTGLEMQAAEGLAGLARPLRAPFTLADLVLPPRTARALAELAAWPATATTVLEAWGLGPRLGKGRGLTALFKGPSGTGKTMAASAVAHGLGLPLFRVDLAGMISKYIGETEKNLDRLFAAADRADLVLFFDEADAVFGQRSEVSDSHDRYANLEVSYLLQRLESFEGLSILATNLAQNMDAAFLRRIDLVVEFPTPGPAERQALWARGMGAGAPLGAVDLERLARFELTGGEIRNCWLMAAGQVAREGGQIDTRRLMVAIWRELVKQGRPVRKEAFGEAYGAIRAELGG